MHARWLKHGHSAVLLSWRIYISAVKWQNWARDMAVPEFYRLVKLHISSSSIRPSSVSDFFQKSPISIDRDVRESWNYRAKVANFWQSGALIRSARIVRCCRLGVFREQPRNKRTADSGRTVARESFTIRGAVGDKLCQTYLTFRPLQLYVVQDSSASEYLQNDENLLKRFVGRVSSFQFPIAEQSDRRRFFVFRFPVDSRIIVLSN